jgi:hypothetical protein
LLAIRSGGISVISTPCHVQFLTPDSAQVLGCNFTYMSKSVNVEMDLESFFSAKTNYFENLISGAQKTVVYK